MKMEICLQKNHRSHKNKTFKIKKCWNIWWCNLQIISSKIWITITTLIRITLLLSISIHHNSHSSNLAIRMEAPTIILRIKREVQATLLLVELLPQARHSRSPSLLPTIRLKHRHKHNSRCRINLICSIFINKIQIRRIRVKVRKILI